MSMKFGGGIGWIVQNAKQLEKLGHRVSIFSLAYDAGQSRMTTQDVLDQLEGIEWFEASVFKTPLERFGLPIISVRGLKALIQKARQADVAYIVNAHTSEIIFYLIKILTRCKVVTGTLAPLFFGNRFYDTYTLTLKKAIMKRLDGHHVLNEDYLEYFKSWSLKHVFLVSSGVDTARFEKGLAGHVSSDVFKVLFVGRLAWQKGVHILCPTIAMMNSGNKDRNIEFRLIGSGPLEGLVKEVATKFKNVKHLGYVADNELLEEYKGANVLVMPSKEEGFSLTILEAAASGLPIVASDISGLREVIRNGSNGILVPPLNPDALMAGIVFIYDIWKKDRKRYRSMVKASHAIATEYDWSKKTSDLAIQIRKVI